MTDRPLLPPGRPAVMGILNLTPDSFSDGGLHATKQAALAAARTMIAEGADILDLGGESTRPGAAPVSQDEEMARVIPVLEAIRAESDIPVSVDTMKPTVARAAAAAGADVWNDVTALGAPGAVETAAELGLPVVLMHMKGEPQTMQDNPYYENVVADVRGFLAARADTLAAAGLPKDRIWIDPGIGFGKTLNHNLALIAATGGLAALGYPVVFGASRKRFIAAVDETAQDASDRLGGSLAAALHAAQAGAAVLRVHDVRETVQALAVQRAIAGADR